MFAGQHSREISVLDSNFPVFDLQAQADLADGSGALLVTLMSQKVATCCQKESDGDSMQMLIVILDILASILPHQPLLHAPILQVSFETV